MTPVDACEAPDPATDSPVRPRYHAERRSVLRWTVFFALVGLLILGSWYGDWQKYQRLLTEGTVITGTVTDRRIVVTRGTSGSGVNKRTTTDTAHKLTFRYAAENRTFTAEERVSPEFYDSVATGSPVAVRVARSDPGQAWLMATYSPRELYVLAGFNMAWFLFVGLFWGIRSRQIARKWADR